MQIIRNDLNPCTVELKIVCNSDTVRKGFQKAYKDFAKDKKLIVPGFSKKKHSDYINKRISKMVSEEDARQSAAKHIANDVSKEAIEQQKLEVFERPHVSIDKIDQATLTCEITIKVPLAPIVELGNYKELKVEKQEIKISEEEVETVIENVLRQLSERKMVDDREAQDEDFAMVKLKTNQNSNAKPFMIMIGKSFDELNQALIGMKVGETQKTTLTFPKEIENKELAGKTLDCELYLESLSTMVIPELTDEFVQNIKNSKLKSENVAEFKQKVQVEAQLNKEKEANSALAEDLLTKLMELSTIHVPDTLWETVVEHRINEIAYTAQKNNVSVESILQQEVGHNNVETFIEELKKDAKSQVERAIVAREIFTKENLQISENDMTEALLEMCEDYRVDLKTLYENLQRSNRMHEAQFRAIFNKVLQFLIESTNLKEKE